MAALTVPSERMAASVPGAAPAPAARPGEPILVVEDIVKRFDTQDGVVTALDHVSLTVKPGEFLGIIGPSGCSR